ncbi:MAG: TIR domain-containing protein [Alphaproteobacteria bacterium]|nr:MAG: TIR domain-containing protein [Alphaproteobacteria bacterium]
MADIFVSYASEDRARIEPLVAELESAGYSVWWDRQLKGGARFSAEIENEVRRAGVVLVAWSPNAVQSRWVADEADLALETGNLLPISLDGARSPMGFRQLQTIDFSGWVGGAAPCLDDLLEALKIHTQSGVRTPNEAVALPKSGKTKSDASIAVLPFVNMSSDPEQEFFSDGISEELLNLLSKIKEMTVIARTSSFTFKGTDKSVAEIGELLQVAYVLEGSVRKAGNRVRITAQLIETSNSSHLWSDTYDRTLDDIFAVQDEISAAIVAELKDHILGGATMQAPQTTRSASVGAYEHYMLGQQFLRKRTRENIEIGKHHFESALEADPDYIPAMVGLADAHMLLSDGDGCYGRIPLGEASAAAKPLLDKALEMDPTIAEIHGVLSMYHTLNQDPGRAQDLAEQAIALNANYSRGYNLLTRAMQQTGDPSAPLFSTQRKALERDPVSALALTGAVAEYTDRLRFKEASSIFAQMEAAGVAASIASNSKAILNSKQGHVTEALACLLDPQVAFTNNVTSYNAFVFAGVLGYTDSIEEFEPGLALSLYLSLGNSEAARHLGTELEHDSGAKEDHEIALSLADWKAFEGEYAEANSLLTPFDDPDPDGWGRNFSITSAFQGGILSMFLRRKLGKRASAALILEKLKTIHQSMLADPDGTHYLADYLAAVIAVAEGDTEGALTALETQWARCRDNFDELLFNRMFDELRDEPRFKALQERLDAHIAAERKAAEDAGLLPIPKELLARLREG